MLKTVCERVEYVISLLNICGREVDSLNNFFSFLLLFHINKE